MLKKDGRICIILMFAVNFYVIGAENIQDQEKERQQLITATIEGSQQLNQETELFMPSGSTVSVAKNWFVSLKDGAIVLQEPDRHLHVFLVENNEDSAEHAIAAAWKLVKPEFEHAIENVVPISSTDGYDEVVQILYSSDPYFLAAIAARFGSTWYIKLYDGLLTAIQQHGGDVGSLKIPGMKKESFSGKQVKKLNYQSFKKLNKFVEDARIRCGIPGAAIAIVQDGKIIYEKGFGVREIGTHEKVNSKTQFRIGSITKSLTTLMMAKLVDEGLFDWDTSILEILPQFELGDKELTQKLVMSQMVSDNTGIPGDQIEYAFNYDYATPELRLLEMKTMKPTALLGEKYQYSNLMLAAGGFMAGHAAYPSLELGVAYDRAMQKYVFDQVGMQLTTMDFHKLHKFAKPHWQKLDGTLIVLDDPKEEWLNSIRPAGDIWSSVHDMAHYLLVELNKGINIHGKCVFAEMNLVKRHEPQIKIDDTTSYGLGLVIQDYHGVKVIWHNGETLGFHSDMFFLPEHNVGCVILTNAQNGRVFSEAVKRKVIELFFDGKDESQQMIDVGLVQKEQMIEMGSKKIELHPDVLRLIKFLGTYVHPVIGEINIVKNENGNVFFMRLP